MAVLLLRAARAANITIASTGSQMEKFLDESQIAPYALEDVYELANAGIISGMGDGLFAPLETATRAQAAKIIYLLIQE